MEAEVARKLAELSALQDEQRTLRSSQHEMESTMTHQQTMLAELFSQLSATGKQEVKEPGEAEVFAAALQHTALHCRDSVCVAAAATAAAEMARQRRISLQQAAAERMMQDAPAFWKRYQTYVQAAAGALAAAASGEPQREPLPTFPFTLVETLSLYRFSRLALEASGAKLAGAMAARSAGGDSSGGAAEPGTAAAPGAPAVTPAAAAADYAHNLSTGGNDAVPPGYWAGVAQHLPMSAEQRLAAEAAWRLYAAAIGRLNAERAELQQRLAAAAAGESGGAPQQQQQQPLPPGSSSSPSSSSGLGGSGSGSGRGSTGQRGIPVELKFTEVGRVFNCSERGGFGSPKCEATSRFAALIPPPAHTHTRHC
jgi:hypothetical protein